MAKLSERNLFANIAATTVVKSFLTHWVLQLTWMPMEGTIHGELPLISEVGPGNSVPKPEHSKDVLRGLKILAKRA
jgi:hypothetical protein